MMNITEPTLLVDPRKVLQNISRMAEKANRNKINFRPHFKTHQSQEIGRWFRDYGVSAITVSSLSMAEYFAADGWEDITVAFPVNTLEIDRINRLAKKIKLNLLVESPDAVMRLAKSVQHPVSFFIKIDTGYHRTGVDPQDKSTIDSILKEIDKSPQFTFLGFLTHAGHSYQERSTEGVEKIHRETHRLLKTLKDHYRARYPGLILTIGDTPTCSIMSDFSQVDEIRPGNFVFYDAMQTVIGSCKPDEVAVSMACPVVGKHPDRNELVIYGGSIHFSKDSIQEENINHFGKVIHLTADGWDASPTGMYLKSLSQEHGIIRAEGVDLQKIKEGDVLGVLPIHSCLTADCMGKYLSTDNKIISRFRYNA